jgi:Ras-related protein Rab-18
LRVRAVCGLCLLLPWDIGVDLKIKFIENLDGREKIKLTIWDTAGQERFRSLTSSYYRGAQGVIMVYDVTRRETFDALRNDWLKELQTYAEVDELVLMVVGNKIDLEGLRKVSTVEGRELAQSLAALFMETSAKTSEGIRPAFEELVIKILNTPHFWKRRAEQKREKTALPLESNPEEDQDNLQGACAC